MEEIKNNFIQKIKENKKYRNISDNVILREIENYMKKYQTDLYDEKFAVKIIRRQLHRIYSSYQTKGKKEIKRLLDELKNNENNVKIINEILSTTLSTKERLDKYFYIYNKIFELSKKPESIIDLGCGLNPISINYMNLEKLRYYAYDINDYDIEFINKFFDLMKIDGKAEILDIRDLESLRRIPKSDIIFMFKVYDLVVPKTKRFKKIGEEIINILKEKSEFMVISFATKTLTRKSMNLPRRIGFEMMLDRNNLKYSYIQTDNEIYYVIRKKV
ncbi:MAG: methyltransferase domain-containing protein [Nanoarchaeota archaeon]